MILAISMVNLIVLFKYVYAFETSQFECAKDLEPDLSKTSIILECTLFPSTHFLDYTQLNFLETVNVTKEEDCCKICLSNDQYSLFIIHQMNRCEYQCNFYEALTEYIPLCTNDFLTVGLPAA